MTGALVGLLVLGSAGCLSLVGCLGLLWWREKHANLGPLHKLAAMLHFRGSRERRSYSTELQAPPALFIQRVPPLGEVNAGTLVTCGEGSEPCGNASAEFTTTTRMMSTFI